MLLFSWFADLPTVVEAELEDDEDEAVVVVVVKVMIAVGIFEATDVFEDF